MCLGSNAWPYGTAGGLAAELPKVQCSSEARAETEARGTSVQALGFYGRFIELGRWAGPPLLVVKQSQVLAAVGCARVIGPQRLLKNE